MHMSDKNSQFPLIWLPGPQSVKNLTINHLHRREKEVACETVCIWSDSSVERLILNDVSVESEIDGDCPILVNDGKIKHFISDCLSADDIEGHGTIEIFN